MTLQAHLPVKTFNAVSLAVNSGGQHVLWASLVKGLNESWNVRGDDSIIPSKAGRTARSRVRDTISIEIVGVVVGTGATPALQVADTRARLTTLTSLFDPTMDPADLVVELEDGDEATISCRPRNLIMLDYPDPVYRPFSVEFEAVGADWVIAAP